MWQVDKLAPLVLPSHPKLWMHFGVDIYYIPHLMCQSACLSNWLLCVGSGANQCGHLSMYINVMLFVCIIVITTVVSYLARSDTPNIT